MKNTTRKMTIWQNINLDVNEWDFDNYENKSLSESEKNDLMYDINNDYLDDERANLNINLSEEIIAIGTLGLWNGTVSGYKEIGCNLSDCLYDNDCAYVEWYVDNRKNLRMTGYHHDGTNHILYRVFKDNLSEQQKENFKEKLYCGTATTKDITRYTRRLGDVILHTYGF